MIVNILIKMSKSLALLRTRHPHFEIPDIKLNSKIFNPGKKKSKAAEILVMKDLHYQYFTKEDEERRAYKS